MKSAAPLDLALATARKHLELYGNFDHYTGIVTMHGLARLAAGTGEPALVEEVRSQFLPYARGERSYGCNHPNYLCGGNGAAYLLWKGFLPEVETAARHYANHFLNEAPRDSDGIVCMPKVPEQQKVWIDSAFAITPFLLFTGLALNEGKYIEEAFQQTAKMVRVFLDPENGLLHQSKNFRGLLPGNISEDHWSRGNGWGIYGLTELACYLPADHPRKEEAVQLFRDHVAACLAVQNEEGLWHQEMTDRESYVETSGSGLILYAIGLGLQAGILDSSCRASFERGLSGLLAYISQDLDIYHTCRGCLCPGTGTKLEYRAVAPIVNDRHAFGPVVLCMGQAHLLGITHISKPQLPA